VSRGRPAPTSKTTGRQWLILLVSAAVVARWGWLGAFGLVIVYAVICGIWPIATCGKCQGSGKLFAPVGKAYRTCPRCSGQGSHVRLGAAIWHSGDD
jgi:hypothetical protein